MSPRDERLLDLMERYRDLRAEGAAASVDQLCADCPDLADELRGLIAFNDRLEQVAAPGQASHDTNPSGDSTGHWEPGTPSAPSAVEPPPAVPGYADLVWLGRGGMGVVYRGRHVRLDRPVALKLVRAERLTAEALARLQAEARAVARLDHPNIVKVFEVGECRLAADGAPVPFVALEFVAGGSLEDRLGRGRLGPAEAARLVRLLARAMHHAHQRGVVHRDLKPDNVLLAAPADEPALNTALGCPKVTDFGLAQSASADERVTQSGYIMGTPAYMAPEQADGRKDVGPPADVYALGAILYRLLAGKPPFEADSVIDLLYKVRHDPPAPLRPARPEVPAGLEAVCLECLAKDPPRRPTAAALAERLGAFVEGEAPAAPARRSRRWLLGVAAAVALLAVAAVVASRGGRRAEGGGAAAPGEPLPLECKRLTVRVWDGARRPKGRVGVDAGAVPVRQHDLFQVEAELNQPAYVFLLLIDGQGTVLPLHPWNDGEIKVESVSARPPEVRSAAVRDPSALNSGRPFDDTEGLETVLLLARREPLPAGVDLAKLLSRVPPAPLREPGEVVKRGWDRGRAVDDAEVHVDQNRGAKKEAVQIDEQLVQVASRLAGEFELIRAVQFAHVVRGR